METNEQINQDFNVKKKTKKGPIIAGIIALVVIVSIVAAYFLVFGNPKYIFGKAIDKVLATDATKYDSIKVNTKIKAKVNAEDYTYQEAFEELEKITIEAGSQIDIPEKKEIINLGLDYDKEQVIDAQLYYEDGNVYTYLDGLFDEYIQIEMDDATKEEMDEIFDNVLSEEQLESSQKAVKIFKNELKEQINKNGKFEKKKDKIEIDGKDKKVTKWTLTLTEKQLYKVVAGTFSNLAKNDKFLDCFEEKELKDSLKEAAELMEDADADSKNYIKISIYTKGLLNEIVAVDGVIYSDLEEMSMIVSVVKEDKGVYTYKLYEKMTGEKTDLINGKVEIEKDKDSKKEQSGKIKITGNVYELGSAELEIDYAIEYNKGIDKINVRDSVNIEDLSEEELNSIVEELMERPLIGDLFTSMNEGLYEKAEEAVTLTEEAMLNEAINLVEMEIYAEYAIQKTITEEEITEEKIKNALENYLMDSSYVVEVVKVEGELKFTITVNGKDYEMDLDGFRSSLNEENNETETTTPTTTSQNEVKDEDYGYSVTYSVPKDFEYDEQYSYDDMKFYDKDYEDYKYTTACVSLGWYTESEYIEDEIGWDYNYYSEKTDYYKNVNISEEKTITVGDKTFKYKIVTYEASDYEEIYQNIYVWYPLDDEHLFIVELESTGKEITEDVIKGFLNISVKEI